MTTTKGLVSEIEIERFARKFEKSSVEEVLEWAVGRFAPNLAMTSSFGAEGIVLIEKLARIAPDTPIIYLDTGYHFAETEKLKEQMRERYDLKIIEQRAELTVEQQDAVYGDRLYERDPDLCCKMRKVEPLHDALNGYHAWIAALRRDQSPTRSSIKKVEWNAKRGMVKINPL